MELWDIYDAERRRTGRFIERGQKLGEGEYHLVVQAWIRNSRGEWLISRRCPTKPLPLKWEATGGSVLAGEDSLTGALREVKEELGVTLDPAGARLISSTRADRERWSNPGFLDVWLFSHDCELSDVTLQEGETCGAKWVSTEELAEMEKRGELAASTYTFPPFRVNRLEEQK